MGTSWRHPDAPRDTAVHGTVYSNYTDVNRASMRGYTQPVRAQVAIVIRPWDGELNHKQMHVHGPHESDYMVVETLGVPVPNPGRRRPPGPGNWRTSKGAKMRPAAKMDVRPTGGRIERNTGTAPKPPKRRRKNAPVRPIEGAHELFASWENRNNAR